MRPPSIGFVWGAVVLAGALSFFAWGLSTPPLEAVWTMTIELGAGSRGRLDEDERRQLARAMMRHPKLAEDIAADAYQGILSSNDAGRVTKKYAYLVRIDGADPRIVVRYDGVRNEGAVKVRMRVDDRVEDATISPDRPFETTLPDGPYPQLVELRFPQMKKKDAVRIERGSTP